MRNRSLPIATVLLSILLGYALWTLLGGDFRTDPGEPRLRRLELELASWPAELDGLTILAAGDLHLREKWRTDGTEERLLAAFRAAAAEADLVVLLGDFINGHFGPNYREDDQIEFFRKIQAPLGVYAVQGNHDGDPEKLQSLLARSGVQLLQNHSRILEFRGQPFQLIGLGYPKDRHLDWSRALLGRRPGVPSVVLSHTPAAFDELPGEFELQLSGHSHGGQLRLPLLGSNWLPGRFHQRYDQGHFRRGTQQLYVTSGVGTSNLEWRLNCPPELVLLTLRSKAPKRTADWPDQSAAPESSELKITR